MIARAAADEATRKHMPGATRLNEVVTLYGKAGEKNETKVVFGLTGVPMSAQTVGKETTISVDSRYFAGLLRARDYMNIAKNATHEADHGLMQRADPALAATTSRRDLKFMELSAYHTQGYVNSALGIDDPGYGVWTTAGGWNRAQINTNANASVTLSCAGGGCTP